MTHNKFSDYTDEQKEKMFGYKKVAKDAYGVVQEKTSNLLGAPDSYDARDDGLVTDIKD